MYVRARPCYPHRPCRGGAGAEAAAAYDSLAPHEQAAASLGVSPNELKPIGFMNAAHYEQLKAQNALSDDLARQIEAYKVVASSE